MPLPPWLDISLQVVGAFIVILILYVVTLFTLRIDSLVKKDDMKIRPRDQTMIIEGFAGPSFLYDTEFNTVNPFTDNFRKIPRSVNHSGGASFTYQFWIKVEEPNDELFKDLTILLKGDKTKYNLAYYDKGQAANTYDLRLRLPPDAYIACPSISFGSSYRQLKIRFNSNNDVMNEVLINMDIDAEPSSRKNLLSLLPLNWTLLTFVFEDNFSLMENADNGIRFSFYINDTPYWIESASSTKTFKNDFLKQNDGNLYLFPSIPTAAEFVKIGNIKYYNYAVTQDDIRATFLGGPPTYAAVKSADKKNSYKPAYISALNKVDIYNY